MVKKILKWPSLVIALVIFGLGFSGCGGSGLSPNVATAFDTKQDMYVQRNMFISGFGRYGQRYIETTNYGNGEMIPVNSRVTFKDINSRQMSFIYNGRTIILKNIPKYSNTTMDQMVQRYFSANEVNLDIYTKDERKAILTEEASMVGSAGSVRVTPFGIHSVVPISTVVASKIFVGMSKEAVLISRGYPPTHATSSINSNRWKYWDAKHDARIIEFKDNKVSNIID